MPLIPLEAYPGLAKIFGILGNLISCMVFLAPVPTFYRIYKNKCTEGFKSLPYVVALFSCMLWLFYGIMKTSSFYIISINTIGCGIEVIYCVMYIVYAPRHARKSTIIQFVGMNVVLFTLIYLLTTFAIPKDYKAIVLGWICVAMSVSVFAAPLSIVVRVVKTRSVKYMPFNLSLFLTLSAIIWFGYGFFKKDMCIYLPNVVGLLLGIIQMVLYVYYSRYGGKNDEEQDQGISIVVVNPLGLGSCDVFPFPLDENDDIIEEINQQLQVKKLGLEDENEKQEKNVEAIELGVVV
ncbi:bidirectional sugar transporter N3-like [Vicia villosa]|uniref:bidirectional sugar transporter N3-like n=1 Tax=Vicia villosa TaxID=3911 RepID=UPI00273C9104|nr:bidirectional sugar transporter N3-like [Vicia villosa]